METDGDYDVAEDYLDRAKLVSYTEVMANNAFERFSKDLKKRWRGMTKKGQATNLERATAKIQAARTKFMEECMYGHSPTSDESERGSCESFHFVVRSCGCSAAAVPASKMRGHRCQTCIGNVRRCKGRRMGHVCVWGRELAWPGRHGTAS